MSITLPTELEQSLQRIAQATGAPLEELVQQAVKDFLARYHVTESPPVHPCIGMGQSGQSDLAQRDEALLWDEA